MEFHTKIHTTPEATPEAGSVARWNKQFRFSGRTWTIIKRKDAEAAPYWLDVRIHGRRIKRSLETNVAKVAQARAIQHYLQPALAGRWDEIEADAARGRAVASLGEVCARYLGCPLVRAGARARRENVNALRRIVRAGLGLGDQSEVDGRPVSVLSRGLVRAYQAGRLALAGEDRLARDRQAITANSTLRQARSVFGTRVMALEVYEGLELGDLSGFMRAPKLDELKRDHYELPPAEDVARLLADLETLAKERPELWLVAVMAMQTGLRRSELVAARWRWIEPNAVRVRFEPDFVPKGKKERLVPVDAGVLAQVRRVAVEQGWPVGDGDFILPGASLSARMELFRELGAWMKGHGWTRRQKAHELRKIYASVITASAGAYVAKVALGHQDIRTTERYAARPAIQPVDVAAALQALRPAAPATPQVVALPAPTPGRRGAAGYLGVEALEPL